MKIANSFNPLKNKSQLFTACAALSMAMAPTSALAGDADHNHDVEQHGSHEHGAANLSIATTNSGIEIVLESPAANIVGFEHQPQTQAQHDTVSAALAALRDGAKLFMTNDSAGCVLTDVDIDMNGLAEESHDDHDEHKTHDDHGNTSETHTDVDAAWVFICKQPHAISSVTVNLFSAFEGGFEDIDVAWITAEHAGQSSITTDTKISLEH